MDIGLISKLPMLSWIEGRIRTPFLVYSDNSAHVLELTQVHTSRVYIAFQVNTVATDERLRNFEPRLSDEDDTRADNSPSNHPHHTNVRTFDLDVFNVHQLLFNAKLLWHQGSNTGHEFITMTIRLPWPQKKIASLKEM
ncbi:hypothetical protein TNCV_984021 [Trichonephila clavipes]|nr:hypothetical protein TNCV_984021 [Trichonephila clavipes]